MRFVKPKKRTDKEVEDNWNSVWKDILMLRDGSVNIDQLKLELMDYSDLHHRMCTLTSELTDGMLSYGTYPVKTILEVHEECLEKQSEYVIEEDKEIGRCGRSGRDFDET
jgi:hypothetical protein